ncbi:Transthyretin-like family protein [Acanthocheilonema viteae]
MFFKSGPMVFWQIFLLLGCVALYVNAGVVGSIQSVTVTGQVGCGNKSVRDVEIELWEEDVDNFDDLLNTTISDAKGAFKIYGQDKEIAAIQPYLLIKHSCDNGRVNPKCTISDEHPIPKEYIDKTYDMHIISLSIPGRNHKKKCSNE